MFFVKNQFLEATIMFYAQKYTFPPTFVNFGPAGQLLWRIERKMLASSIYWQGLPISVQAYQSENLTIDPP